MINTFEFFCFFLGIIQGVRALQNKQDSWFLYIFQLLICLVISAYNRLYGDVLNNFIYIMLCIGGLIIWRRKAREITRASKEEVFLSVVLCILIILFLYYLLNHITDFIPFIQKGQVPLIDSITTATSFVAMCFMIYRRIDCWLWWGVNDLLYVVQYAVIEGFHPYMVILNLVWFVMAIVSFLFWKEELKDEENLFCRNV